MGISRFGSAGPTFGVDASQNYKTLGNTEIITLQSPQSSFDLPQTITYEIPIAKRRNSTFTELAPSGGVYRSARLTWLLPAELVSQATATHANEPAAGLQIRDGFGVTWTITEANLNTLRSTWVCVCINLSLALNLRSRLRIKRPNETRTTDATGSRSYAYPEIIYDFLPCRLQETSAETSDKRGKRLTTRKYSLWVDQKLDLTIEDKAIIDEDEDVVYEVKGWDEVDRLDRFQRIDVLREW